MPARTKLTRITHQHLKQLQDKLDEHDNSLDAVDGGGGTKLAAARVQLATAVSTGTTLPLSLADAQFTGKAAGGRIDGTGTVGVVAGSFATATAEGNGAGGAQLFDASTDPYPSANYPGNRDVAAALQKADGDDLMLRDVLSTATGADASARVYGYLAFRSDLGANLKWRLWFTYRRASDGAELVFTPNTSVTSVKIAVPEVFTIANLPVGSGLGVPLVLAQTAAAIAAGSVGTTELADSGVTTAKLATGALSADAAGRGKMATGFFDATKFADAFAASSIASLTPFGAAVFTADATGRGKFAAGFVDSTLLGAASVVAGKYGLASIVTADLADDAVDAAKLKDDATVDGNRAVTTNHIRDAAVTAAKLAATTGTGSVVLATSPTITTPTLSGAVAATGLHTHKPSATVPSDAILLDIDAIGAGGTRDSHRIVMRGRSNDGVDKLTEWRFSNDITSTAGISRLFFESRIDAGGFSPRFALTDDGFALAGSAGAVGTPVFSWINDANTGLFSPGADALAATVNGTEALRADFNVAVRLGVFGVAPAVRQAGVENITNSVTAGGVDGTIANYTDLVTYANDAAAIRNDIYQLARSLAQAKNALRLYGWLT